MGASEIFHIKNLDELRSEAKRLNVDLPIEEEVSILGNELELGGKMMPNRFCVQPMEGYDAQPDGSPGQLTFRRYIRYAEGGPGMIWIEATAVLHEARSNPAQLYLHKDNVDSFAELVKAVKHTAKEKFDRDILVILQLAHSGRYSKPDGVSKPIIAHHSPKLDKMRGVLEDHPVVSDEYLDNLQDVYVEVSRLASEAGFDGVDIKSCHRCLISGLLASFTREGKYGGSFENRTRFLRETISKVKEAVPSLLVSTRMNAYDAVERPYGFGVDEKDSEKPDLEEPIKLVGMLKDLGVPFVNISTGLPFLGTDIGISPDTEIGLYKHEEHPLEVLNKIIDIAGEIQGAFPDLPVIGNSYSWLRQFIPNVGAGVLKKGKASILGVGRNAMAYPGAVKDVLETGKMDPFKCCITCSACIQLMLDGGPTGCVIKDSEIYGEEYQVKREFSMDNLKREADRCHDCESAGCTEGCPAHIDIPGFVKAFGDDDIEKAYGIIRQSSLMPQMCSRLCPVWLQCEGGCIENTLSGNPISIHDLECMVSWLALEKGLTKVKVPDNKSGKKVAVVGGGPAGIACAVKLIESGHSVVIFDKDKKIGGVPETIIRASRFVEAQTEINALIQPALEAGVLELQLEQELGKDVNLDELSEGYDAVLLAAGIWQEASLGPVRQAQGGHANNVMDALAFLRKAKSGEISSVPERVAVLAGGDSTMDASAVAKELGAVDLYVVYPGSISEMHWHLPDSWFRANGAHCLTLTKPIGYELDNGKLSGLKVSRIEHGEGGWASIPGSETVMKVDMVIEAMGIKISDELESSLKNLTFSDVGLVQTKDVDSFETGMSGVFVAGALINGGASVVQCISEGMKAASEIDGFLS